MKNIIHNEQFKRIEYADERYYTADGENYFPSVTEVLSAYPKNKYLLEWMKQVGYNADIVLDKAAEEGSQVHNAIEDYLAGEEVFWADEKGDAKYKIHVWKMILKFVEFWERYTPKLIASEQMLVSPEHELGGTLDIVAELNGEIWEIDIKSSNNISPTHFLQLSIYADMWNSLYGKKKKKEIQRRGILWLKAKTRTEGKGGAIQGKGWQLKESGRELEEELRVFNAVHSLYKEENPGPYKPANLILPDRIKLKK